MRYITDIIWTVFLIFLLLYSCTDRHIIYEIDGIKHEIWVDKEI
jgi:hypothetical protein